MIYEFYIYIQTVVGQGISEPSTVLIAEATQTIRIMSEFMILVGKRIRPKNWVQPWFENH